MKCRVCNEELIEGNNRCLKCGFNNEPYMSKEIENNIIDEEIKKENNIQVENNISISLLVISIIVYIYLRYVVGFIMDSFGTYYSEAEGPSIKEALIVFSLSLPGILAQIICYSKYLKNKFNVKFLSRLAVKFVYLYAINRIFLSFFGVAVIWIYILVMPLILAAIIIVLKS